MEIKLYSVSNPGISFTEDVDLKLISLYEYVKRNKEKRKSYSDFQDELINEQIFSGSYIRSFIPFLHNFGVIKDYEVVNYSDFFSMNGEMYIKNIINYYNLRKTLESNEVYNNKLLKMLKRNKEYFLCLFLDYYCENKIKYYEDYLDILYFVTKYGKISKDEFYLYKYCKINKLNSDEIINKYRMEPDTFKITFQDKNGNEITNNAFNYFIAFLSEGQCNYLVKTNHNYYQMNESRRSFVDSMINEYMDFRGYHE